MVYLCNDARPATMSIVNEMPQPATASELFDLANSSQAVLLRDLAYERIKDAIRMAEFHPGEPLSETRLSKQLGISRTPVREALQVLAQEGLVQIIPGRAVTVADPTLQEVMDAFHLRVLLEPEVVRLSTRTITSAQLGVMWDAVAGLEAAAAVADRLHWTKKDHIFHETLTDACPNRLLGELSMQIRNRISYLSIDIHGDTDHLLASAQEHRAILQSIANGDASGAEAAMRTHIAAMRDSVFRRLTQHYT